MGHSWISIVGWLVLGLTCVFALLKGDLPERLGAAWLLALNLAGDAVMALTFPHAPQIVMFSLDLLLAIGLLALALKYSSLWLGAAMLLQSSALLAHAIRLGNEGLNLYQWMVFNDVVTQLMQLCIVIATGLSWRARRKPKAAAFHFVPDPSAT